ncbi:hypothetical protein OCGS_0141 [Oceaniovalibus guishaninsula JLT2003]|uniref:L-ornithine N(alpha)-acyltransferase n=1 Tax=Oceaniovalibus guishaninsula JLT2003 TaxID=1231392 RepID=K2HGY7_9RHOB|nr:GNAT family N-acyltransferase [Oceaniovalibus guishaninsula]EKE45722.1 hypothetical protein OCGS_0141 [Oceaniovalibus guishaninsula JLT2003]
MILHTPRFAVRPARDADDVLAAQRLRYAIFVGELGGTGDGVDHAARLERDEFDTHCDHLLLEDLARPEGERVVGVYRLLRGEVAGAGPGFCSAREYDLAPLLDSGRNLLELGRSCLHPAYRGSMAMHHLWVGLADYARQHDTGILFGVASFPGTDTDALAASLSVLHHRHLAPPHLRVRARPPGAVPMNSRLLDRIDRVAAMRAVPPLIKAYLRLGGVVGDGAFVDRAFNTVDVCMVLDAGCLDAMRAAIYRRDGR